MKKVTIIFGGKSGEHEVSVKSALSVESNIDKDLFEVGLIGISPTGSWISGNSINNITSDGKVIESDGGTLPTGKTLKQLLSTNIIFPVIHGTHGEDGTLQGLLDIANIPYVGSGVLGSSVCMDKSIQKQLCEQAGIPQTNFISFNRSEWSSAEKELITFISKNINFPLFIKPANLGSSVGITKSKNKDELIESINEAFQFDNKVVIEAGQVNMTEVEVSVMGNDNPLASVCGSIAPNSEFYDYETKYVTNDIISEIPAKINEEDSKKIRKIAIKAYKVLNCEGLARVDFFYDNKTHQILLNEVNTMPGFTKISMYPKLWRAAGLSYKDLITKLLEFSVNSWQAKQQLKYTY